MHFETAEYEARIAKVRQSMAAQKMDLLILFGQEAVQWTSGYYTPAHFAYAAFGIPLQGEPFLIIRYLEAKAAEANSWVKNYETYWDHEDPILTTKKAVERLGLAGSRIGLEKRSWFLTAERYDRLKDALPNAEFIDDERMTEKLRFVKSAAELDYIRQASRIVDVAMHGAVQATQLGATERDIAAAMAFERLRAGSDLPVDGVLTTGERILEGHGPWTDRKILHGDGLHYEFHGIKNQYWSRILRCGVMGEPNERQLFVYNTIRAAQDLGLAKMKAGVVASQVDALFRAPMIEAGLKKREVYTNRLGYGMGLNARPSPGEFLHEFTPTSDFVLEEGMVFHMIMAGDGLGVSDTVAVTKDGIEYLTQYSRDLFIAPVK